MLHGRTGSADDRRCPLTGFGPFTMRIAYIIPAKLYGQKNRYLESRLVWKWLSCLWGEGKTEKWREEVLGE